MKNKKKLQKIITIILLSFICIGTTFAGGNPLQKQAEKIINNFSERVKKDNPSEEKQILIYKNIIATINKIKVKFSGDKLTLLNFLIDEINKKGELLGIIQTPVLTDYDLEIEYNNVEFDNDSNSENILDEEEKYLNKLFREARNFSNKKLYKKAIEKYSEILEIDQTKFVVYYNLGIMYDNIKDYKKAIEFYEKVLKLKSNYSSAYNNLAFVYDEINENNKKIFYYFITETIRNKKINYNKLRDNAKKIYDLEYKKIKKFVDEKKFDELRDYTLEKY